MSGRTASGDLPGIDDDQFRAVSDSALHAQRNDRMGFGRVRSRDEEKVSPGQLLDGVRHGTLANHDRHTGDRGSVSGTGTVIDIVCTDTYSREFLHEVIRFGHGSRG